MVSQGRIELGTVIAPSGKLLIIDAGLLGMWSHDGAPLLSEGILPDDVTTRANECVDATIVGADAEKVGRELDRQWNPRFIYDVSRDQAKELAAQVEQLATTQRLDAHVEICAERVSHRRRADHALEHGNGAGEVQFHGVWAGVVSGIPQGELRVIAERMPKDDPDAGRLRTITLVASDRAVAKSERFAYAGVDWARLMFVDLDAVGLWKHETPMDGLADFAFWGRDAAVVAARTNAVELEPGVFGWRDQAVQAAVDRGMEVEQVREREQLKFATDFRPHSHHYQLMQQVRASSTESGIVTIGDARACGFATTWGDGIFDLYRNLDAEGRLVSVRIELGTEQRRTLMRQLEFRWSKSALVSKKIMNDGQPVRFMYREVADRDEDSGWRMFSGTETEEYNEHADSIAIVPLDAFADIDMRVDKLLDEPVGSVFERREADHDFYRVTDWKPAK